MQHPIKKGATMKIRAVEAVGYVSAGEVYWATPYGKRSPQVRFDCEDYSSGTMVARWQFDRAIKSGAFVVVAQF